MLLLNYVEFRLLLHKHLHIIIKELIRKTLEEMPDKFTVHQFIDHLALVQKVERGIKQSEEDDVISHKRTVEEFESWFK